MWMMGYNDGGDSFGGRKIRSLMPKPSSGAAINPPCLGRIHGGDLLSFNQHLAAMTEQSKRDFNAQQIVVSSRWNPTPEQLQTLEELYRRGTRTPSADQIQQITAQLRRYGKIEGKNVFYWFQNHKARERQKRRRQLESSSRDPTPPNMDNSERKESGPNGTGLEVEETKNWASPPTNCSILPEKTVSMQKATKATIPECGSDGWVQFDDAEFQQRKSLEGERNATWHMMQPLSSSSSSSPTNHIINSSAATSSTAVITTKLQTKPIKLHQNLDSIFSSCNTETLYHHNHHHHHLACDEARNGIGDAHCIAEPQTLQLFPLRSCDHDDGFNVAETESAMTLNGTAITPQEFFEFLPLKN